MKELYKKYKREIWVGVVVSLITSAIIKFGDWLLDVVPTVGTTISETLSNVLYSLAATYSDSALLSLILLGGFSIIVGSSLKNIVDSLKLYRTVLVIEKEAAKVKDEDKKEIFVKALSDKSDSEPKDAIDKVNEGISLGKKAGRHAFVGIALLLFMYILINSFYVAPMDLSNKFKRDIVKITPYVEEYDIKKLESDWVCMRSKSDYDKIYEVINEVKESNNLPN